MSSTRLLSAAVLGGMLSVSPLIAAEPAPARLGTDVVPTFQSVHLRVNADSARYSGSVRVELEVKRATPTVALHARGQDLDQVTLTQNGAAIAVEQARGDRGRLTLTAARPLAVGKATLEIRFRQAFNTKAVALYRMEKDGAAYSFTQFEAEEAREAFPCWDEPSFKFPYQFTLEVPEAHQAVFNTPVERETRANGWKTIIYKRTPPMPSYLLAIATGPLEFTPIPGLKMPARVVTVRGQSNLTAAAVEWTPRIMTAVESWFGQPYPYEKLDLIAVPEYWAGAMENPGAITYADNVLLLDPKSTSPAQLKTQVRITAHELAHMWFGDLVTMAWWDDLWLNESFAEWLGDKITDKLMPEYHHWLGTLPQVQDIMASDARPSTDPIRIHAQHGDEAMHSIGVAYYKGKAVLSMFEHWMGEETFRKGVREYLKAHAWGNATAADLWKALGAASGKDVVGVMGDYVEQNGLPLVTVEPQADGSVRLSQKRFLNFGVQAPARTWRIPMDLRFPQGKSVTGHAVLLGPEPQAVKLGSGRPAWVMPNAGARGYYRWKVPPGMLTAMSGEAATIMAPEERIGFIGNLLALLGAGEISGDVLLKALAEVADDPEPLVVSQVVSGLDRVRNVFVTDEMRDPFAAYVRRTLRPAADRFGLQSKPGEAEVVGLLRPRLMLWLGVHGGDEGALKLGRELADKYLADPASVDPSLVQVALQLKALTGDRAVFETYKQRFEQAKQPAVRRNFLQAFGYFRDPAVLPEVLKYAAEGPVRPNEMFAIPFTVGTFSEEGADRAFQWVRDHYDVMAKKLPPNFLPFLTAACGGCSAERLAQGKAFFAEPAHNVAGTDKELGQVAESVEDCVELRKREGAAVSAYLRSLAGAN